MTNWEETTEGLYKAFRFANFSEAMKFINLCAAEMEKMNHHATWKNTYNRVEIWLITHDTGNTITQRDRDLASRIDAQLAEIQR